MSALRPELDAAIAKLYRNVRWETLAGDASTRRFHRLRLPDASTRIVMDYGAAFAGETDDVRIARLFERASLPVARIFEILPEAGALILEDLGDETLETALGRVASETRPSRDELYRLSVELSVAIATRGTAALAASDRAVGPALDDEKFLFEMRFFLEHFMGGFLGRPAVPPELRKAVEWLAVCVAAHPRVLCHRDFHSRNIMVRPNRTLAMVDIQDARWGPDTYDLASLLRDAYVDLTEGEVDRLFDLFKKARPGAPEGAALRKRFDLVAIQRMVKALGTFGYQVTKMGRDRYRASIPRTVERIRRLAPAHPELAPIVEALARP